MAKFVKLTVIQTYSNGSLCTNNMVELQIPKEAAEIIKKYQHQIYKCSKASNNTKTICCIED